MASDQALASSETFEYYNDNGYVVLDQLIPHHRIDRLLDLYQRQIYHTKTKFYRQNTNVYDTNRLTSGGHVIQSFLDIHHYKKFPEFRQAALDLYFSPELLGALTEVTGHARHNLMQGCCLTPMRPPHPIKTGGIWTRCLLADCWVRGSRWKTSTKMRAVSL